MIEKVYYSIGEAAEKFNVPVSTIRYWEQQFKILKPMRNKKGDRFFSQKDMQSLSLIYRLVKEQGMTIAGAKQRLSDNPEGLNHNTEIVRRLQSIRQELLSYAEELKV
ncbi:MAG: MerR family transcriptional regulator [Bacteroidales bacterium]|nr:MerR family transcriptional regulator [Bacteroidales bacterium]